jgi:hypothetical protein
VPHFKSTKARKENCLRAEIGQERCNHLSICPLVEVRKYQGVVKDDYCKYLSTCRLRALVVDSQPSPTFKYRSGVRRFGLLST